MDYVGRSPNSEERHDLTLSWNEHCYLGTLLDQLGCDLSDWPGFNDGDEVRAETCREWSQAIREAMADGRIEEAFYDDARYMGGICTLPVVVRQDGTRRRPHEASEFVRLLFSLRTRLGRGPTFREFRSLDAEAIGWLQRIADFFENCGGCRQY